MADEAKWYVVHTYSGYENAVADSIMKSAENRKMTDLIHEVNIPMETVPGYVLVKMILTDESWHLVRNVRGATGFVGSGNNAIPLTDAEIAQLGVEKHDVRIDFEVGSRVRVADGPLEGFFGTVEEIDLEKQSARVVVSMFGRETPIELDFDQIEADKD